MDASTILDKLDSLGVSVELDGLDIVCDPGDKIPDGRLEATIHYIIDRYITRYLFLDDNGFRANTPKFHLEG